MKPQDYLLRVPAVPLGGKPGNPDLERTGHLFQQWKGGPADAVLIGAPFEQGRRLAGGRPGTGEGPVGIRQALLTDGHPYDHDRRTSLKSLNLADAGDVIGSEADMEDEHRNLADIVKAVAIGGGVPIVMGGSHDNTYGSFRGLKEVIPSLGLLMLDGYPDMGTFEGGRVTSGNILRALLDELVPGELAVHVGTHGFLASEGAYHDLKERQVRVIPLQAVEHNGAGSVMQVCLDAIGPKADALYLSLDIHALAEGYAPGCSFPDAEGLTPKHVREMAFRAGRDPRVKALDLMETAPSLDLHGRTSRLASGILQSFLSGLVFRNQGR